MNLLSTIYTIFMPHLGMVRVKKKVFGGGVRPLILEEVFLNFYIYVVWKFENKERQYELGYGLCDCFGRSDNGKRCKLGWNNKKDSGQKGC